MARHSSFTTFKPAVDRAIERKVNKVVGRVDKVADELLRDARDLASGTETQDSLNKAGNPFGRGFRNPRGRQRGRRQPLPLNEQSGKFKKSLRKVKRDMRTGRFSRQAAFRIESWGVPYAKYVARRKPKLNSKMIYRGYWDQLEKNAKKRLYLSKRIGRRIAA